MRNATPEELQEWLDDTTQVLSVAIRDAIEDSITLIACECAAPLRLAQTAGGYAALTVGATLIGTAAGLSLDQIRNLACELATLANRRANRETT